MSKEYMGQRIKESYCVEWDIWISFKLHVILELVTKRKSDSWKIRISQSIVWNVIEFTRDCLKANNAEYFNGDTSREYNTTYFFLDNNIEWNWERLWKPTAHEFQAFLNVLLHRFQTGFRNSTLPRPPFYPPSWSAALQLGQERSIGACVYWL